MSGSDLRFKELATILEDAENVVFFGGAGVSTESNIPDFRSEAGLFRAQSAYGHQPEYLVSRTAFNREPELFFRYYKENLVYQDAKPNPAHLALAKLEREGKVKAVITQNIDGLHQAAGSQVVHELHGSVYRNHCLSCNASYDLNYLLSPENCLDANGAQSAIPRCQVCGNIVKPDVVLYEEPLDPAVMQAAEQAVRAADTMIVGGTSLMVYPAAGYVRYFSGNNLVFINKSKTALDGGANLIIRANIAQVLGHFLE